MPTSSRTVRAARLNAHDRPLSIEEVQLPEPRAGEQLVELLYGGINPVDRYTAEGRVAPDGPLPRTLGGEASGRVGDRLVLVAGEGLGSARDGLWAEAAIVPDAALIDVPDGVDPQHAAAMGVAGLTAVKCVRELARVRAEDRVIVLGASGGVGSMIVSLARAAGATVWGQTGSEEKAAQISALGAERVLVGGPDEVAGELEDFAPTVGFDPLGDGFVAPLVAACAPRGRLVSFGTSAGPEVTFNMQQLYRKNLSLLGYAGMLVERDERREGLQAALRALAAGELQVRVDSVLRLDDINEAFKRLTDRGVQGKLLLDLGSS